ncbi:MAG: DNA-directed RNA polymerase subunit beta', partial [Parasporobacterium sp.]|nr:DNA-directed RNA polymerase subunit beta' [Parasporobacterium sp.]
SAHGARKGLSDTALRTADSGYLTRRLVDVAQELIINQLDCCEGEEEIPFMEVAAFMNGKEEVEVLRERILGRYAAVDIVDSEGNVLVKKNTMITPSRADKVVAAGIESVKIRTALTCQSETGICSKCYGANMATGQAVQVGEAVGIIAAQSIGEPGTQLTMRTFHTGGVAGEDITQGLPRVEELFEARKPKGVAIISEFAGEAEIRMNKNKREVVVTDDEGREKAYLIPYGSNTTMQEGERVHVEAGDKLTSGSINPHDILKVKDVKAVQDYIMKEVQQVYRLQGVEINDKHIEVIVRQMLKKIRVDEAGDSDFLAGTTVNLSEFNKVNKALIAEGKQPAEGKQIILGITKASLATNSFLSAASFQETTKILTEAAINGKVDPLIGLKENVIIGKLIPAGTGMKRYRDVHLNTDDMILEAKKKAAEEAEAAAAEETENGIEGLPESESEIVEEYIEVIEDESEEISEAETETEEDTEE